MTIASEITDLQNNLAAAKAAVDAKGGTTGDTGLAGLASEIAGIPSGSITNYGTLTYVDDENVEHTLTLSEDGFNELSYTYVGVKIIINNIEILTNKIKNVIIADGVTYLPNNFLYYGQGLTSVTVPSSVRYIGNNVFSQTKFVTASFNFDNVIQIGDSFLSSNLYFNQPISLPKVLKIGESFLQGCSAFNSSLTINDGCQVIRGYFLNNCGAFAQSFSVPSGLYMNSISTPNPYNSFMNRCNKFTGPLVCNCPATNLPTSGSGFTGFLSTNSATAAMYTTGITLTGPYANDWKTALPDSDSSPYRKLIVGS